MAVTKRGERVMTAVGSVVGLIVGVFVLLRITSHRTVSAGFFTFAVFISGIVGMILYVGVKDGIGALLKRAASGREATVEPAEPRSVSGVDTPENEPEPEAAPEPELEEPAAAPAKTAAKRHRPQLRATLPPEPDEGDDEVEVDESPRRSVSTRQRPLRPRD